MAVVLKLALCMLPLVSGVMITSKRTQSSRDGKADEKFFNTYFGTHDNSSTYSECLNRNLAFMLPASIGMHFPTSTTVDKSQNASLGNWQLQNVAALGDMSKYNGLMDWATVFYVPSLDAHIQQFETDGVPVMQRSYPSSSNTKIYVAIVYTPASGHVLELQSPVCTKCTSNPFGQGECAIGHHLPKDMDFYAEAWKNATSQTWAWSTVGPSALPAPMVVQFKQTALDLDLAAKFWQTLMPTQRKSDMDCKTFSATVGVGPFDGFETGAEVLPNYPLEFVFVQNTAQVSSLEPFIDFIDQMHRERVGFGWGWDRAMDFHAKLTDSTSSGQETVPGVSLDHWASSLTKSSIRFAVFNLSQSCDGMSSESSPFGNSAMIYTAGPANLGIEFWGKFNYSFFSVDKPAFFWGGAGGCSPTFDCRSYLSPPDCSTPGHASHKIIRSRVAANPPSNSAYATLTCENGQSIDAIRFASFGTATGTCESGFARVSKCSKDITSQVRSLCIGRRSCNVPASTSTYGVPCSSSNGWWTSVEATCSGAAELLPLSV